MVKILLALILLPHLAFAFDDRLQLSDFKPSAYSYTGGTLNLAQRDSSGFLRAAGLEDTGGGNMIDRMGGLTLISYANGNSAILLEDFLIEDGNGYHVVDWSNDLLNDGVGGVASVDWKNRLLKNSAGTTIASWSSSPFTVTGSFKATGAVQFSNYGAGICEFDASGNVSSVNSIAGGSDTQVQYNNSGALAGNANFTWDYTDLWLGLGTSSPAADLDIMAKTTGDNSTIYLSRKSDHQALVLSGDSVGNFRMNVTGGYHTSLYVTPGGEASIARGNESPETAYFSVGPSYDASQAYTLLVLWPTSSGTGDSFHAYNTAGSIVDSIAKVSGIHTINLPAIPPQSSGVTPTCAVSGQVAMTSTGLLCSCISSAWVNTGTGLSCTF